MVKLQLEKKIQNINDGSKLNKIDVVDSKIKKKVIIINNIVR